MTMSIGWDETLQVSLKQNDSFEVPLEDPNQISFGDISCIARFFSRSAATKDVDE